MTRRASVEQWREMGEPAKRLNPNNRIWSALFVGMLLWGVPRPVQAAIHVVTSAADAGAGTLRAAITTANSAPGLDTIRFNISGGGVRTITLSTALPAITGPTLIDGYSQPGSARNTTGPGTNAVLRIELNGNNTVATGLVLNSNDCIIQGLVINRFTGRGIELPAGRSNCWISGCFLGVNAAGTATSGTGNGIQVTGDHHRIGGGGNADRNIISGATSTAGILVSGAGATYNNVRNNLIGVSADGLTVIGGLQTGIRLEGGATWNLIGESGQNYNRIAGCTQQGVVMMDAATEHNAVTGNYIWANGGLGIDLNGDGPTLNDAGDGDVGPNGLQNYPVIEAAMTDNAGRVYIRFSFQGKINTGYRFDFYANPTPDPSGYGEGQVWIGSIGWTSGGGGSINSLHCTVGNNNAYPAGTMITCTATEDLDWHTSEFAPNVACYLGRPVVTNLSETVNGNTSSLIDLVGTPGADGISLREAVMAANNTFDARTGNFIFFDLPGSGPQTISLQSPLPPITKAVVFGGNTDPEFNGSPVVRIDGTNAGTGGVSGITFNAGWGALIGLCFTNFSGDGITLNRSNCSVFGTYVGVLPDGVTCGGNGGVGIRVNNAQSNIIGSSAGSYGPNVIAGNAGGGVLITGGSATGNVVANCRIGTNAAASATICTQPFGVGLQGNAVSNTVGSTSTAHPNVIGGHQFDGIQVQESRLNTIIGNMIGTDRAGTTALPNTRSGIYLSSAHDNLIGQVNNGNLISGNGTGVMLRGGSLRNTIVANKVGTATNGILSLRNTDSGIILSNGSSNNLIGGTTSAERNIIAAHTNGRGVHFSGGSNNNRLIGNYIGLNQSGADVGNLDGILIENSANNIIGGPTVAERNMISGNDNYGVWINGLGSDGNQVMGNYIGTDVLGTSIIANGTGVLIREGKNNIIGGATPAHGNLISGNTTGVLFLFPNTETNEVRNNRVGTNTDGTSALPNTIGVHLNSSANNNTVANNLVSGNNSDGILIISSNGNLVQENRIGTNANGTAAVANRASGIRVSTGSNATIIRNNLASGNLSDGIALESATNTQVKGNLAGTNAAGTAAIANHKDGVWHSSSTSGTILGGTTAADRNILSGNLNSGSCHENGANNNTTLGNYIGTDINGTASIPNVLAAVYYGPGCTNNTLGGTMAGAGNIISGNSQQGVWIQGSSNTVVGNYIGTDVTGLLDLGNASDGILVDNGSGSLIGGIVAGARNVISGNNGQGVHVRGGANGVTIIGNVIGLDANGGTTLANNGSGVYLDHSSGHVIGGNTAAHRNVISGNTEQGVRLLSSSNSLVLGNYLGTDTTGLVALGNGRDGVSLEGASQNNIIGGVTLAERNIISGNDQDGVWLTSSDCRSNHVKGNWIGYNAAGADLGNNWYGVAMETNTSGNLIGGTAVNEGNRIGNSRSAWSGVVVEGSSASANRILGNSIENNGLGIDLGADGVTLNDNGDIDNGANGRQNFPVLTSSSTVGGNTVIAGSLNSIASTTFRIEFFSSPTGDASGHGEGVVYLGSTNVTTNGSGNATIAATLTGVSVASGHAVTATATNSSTNNTSEFAANVLNMAGGTISGTVFEDVNYGGGAGRDRATALANGGSVRPGARVELYDGGGDFLSATTTNASGQYLFNNLPQMTDYYVRVVNGTVTSGRAGYVPGLVPVQTFRTASIFLVTQPQTDRVGGEFPSKRDADNGSTTLAALATANTDVQSLSLVNLQFSESANIDFGFNFNLVVNTNDAGQGSLRQFILNANALNNTGLAIQGQPAGRDVALFMIADGQAHPGLNTNMAGLLTSGAARIVLASALPEITETVTINGALQTSFVGNTNAGAVGTGGFVGVDALALSTYQRPEVAIDAGGFLCLSVNGNVSDVEIAHLAVYNATTGVSILGGSGSGHLLHDLFLGLTAAGADPGVGARNTRFGTSVASPSRATVRNCYIGHNGYSGITGMQPTSSVTITGCETFSNGWASSGYDGIDVDGANSVVRGNLTYNNTTATGGYVAGAGSGIELGSSSGAASNNLVENNTTRNNVGAGITVRSGMNGVTIRRNIVTTNSIGVLIGRESSSANDNLISQNQIHGNTGLGIDLSNATNGPDGVTLNDLGDVDTGSNGLLNFPVIASVLRNNGQVTITGFARPGSLIEFFVSDNDASGFGEGQQYVFSATEGSSADLDNTTGSYGPGAVNGVAQGTDNTNRFAFIIPSPPTFNTSTKLSATATLANNTSEFSGAVMVVDNTAPTAVCQTMTLYLDATGNATVPASFAGSSFDPDGTITSIVLDPPNVTCAWKPGGTILAEVTDNMGAVAACSTYVHVVDTVRPIIVGCPANINQSATNGCHAMVWWPQPTVTDNCSGATITRTSGPADGFIEIGVHTVVYTATDASGNTATCSFTITIVDNIAPYYFNCPSNITVNAPAGSCTVDISGMIGFGIADNCEIVTNEQVSGPDMWSPVPVGVHTMTRRITDRAGLTAECTFQVTVRDVTPPSIAGCPANITVDAGPMCTGTATWSVPTVADNCTGATIVRTTTKAPGSTFAIGTHTVNYLATDASGNTSTCSFTVTVRDVTAPTITCPGNITRNADPGMCSSSNTDIGLYTSGSTCSTGNTVTNNAVFPLSVGTHTITWTATDDNGNYSTCQQTVTIVDAQAPVITGCPSNITLNANGDCKAVANWTVPTVSDNCSGTTITRTAGPAPGSEFQKGTTTVTYTATDASGNTSTCSFTVTVNDTTAPVYILCPGNQTRYLAAGQCTRSISGLSFGYTDNCPGFTNTQISGTNLSLPVPVGVHPVTFHVTDAAGNVSANTCSFTVTVLDTIRPVISGCPANITRTTGTTGCNRVVTWDTPMVDDNCTGATITRTSGPPSGSSFPQGTTTITYTATDASGNMSTCSFTVTVLDETPPHFISCQTDLTAYVDGSTCTANVYMLVNFTYSDNCGVTSLMQTSGSDYGQPLAPGVHPMTFTLSDPAGNTATCSFTVTVLDQTPPSITCPADITVNNTTGVCGAVVHYVAPVGTDNCSGSVTNRTAGPATNSTFPVGSTTVTHVVTDAAGLSTSCSFIVTVIDAEAPVAHCRDITVNIGTASITAAAVNNNSSDNCGITGMSVSPSGPFNNVGVFPVTLTVTDAAGNSNTCTANVTVTDSNPPTAVCQDVTIHLNGAGTASITPTMLDGGSTDNGNITGMDVSQHVFGCSDLGANDVTLFVTDDGGNTSICIATVTVLDTITPTISCPANITVNNAPGICGAPVTYTLPTATDNCPGFTITRTVGPASGATFPVGVTTVTHRVTDLSGNWRECSFLVTVNDNEAPTVTCPANITVNVANGTCQAVVNYDPPTVVDNCGNATLTRTAGPASGSSFPVGVTHVIHQITHGGQTNSCAFSVTVVDHIAPVIVDCPGNLEVTAGGACTATATWTAPTFTDNCTGGTIVRTGPAPGSTFPIGNTTITYTATDAAGNTATCSFIVTVVDNTAPQIIGCPSDIVVSAGPACTATASWTAPTFTDNCAGGTLVRTGPASGSAFPIGTTTITYMATDAAGNSTECSFLVTVFDQTAPTISCPANIVVGNDPGVCDAVVNYATPVGTDNCSGSTTALTDGFASGSIFPLGTTTVTHTVTDAAGLTASCSFTVTVNDTEAPVAICQNVIADIGGLGSVTITADQVNNGSTDNCGITAMSVTPSTFTAVGTYTVTLTVTDAAGNTDDCTATVTITDNNPPTALCNDTTLYLGSAGTASIQAADLDGGSTDNGSIASITASLTAFNCGHVGANNVTLTVTDDGGNSATCISVVTVLDTIHPVITCQTDQAHTNNSGQCGATVTYLVPTATDNCTVTITRTNGPASGSFFPIGTTEVTHEAVDASGNRVSCTFLITVEDNTLPVLNCIDDITLENDPGICGAVVNYVTPVGTDNCPGVTTTLMEGLASGSVFPVGVTTVSHEAEDASGNRIVCFFTVTVTDTEDPVAICQNVTADLGGSGSVTITAAQVNNGSTDNCAVTGMSVSPSTFTAVGTYPVTLTVTDAAGNTDVCTATVTITDNSPPVALCNDTTIYLNSAGQATINAVDLDGGSTDNGTIASYTADQTAFDCSDLGANNVTLTVTDDGGNTATCVAVVTVLDTIAPTVVCQAITAYLDADGQVTINAPALDGGIADNCGTTALSFQLSNSTFDCDDLGPHAVTLTVTDASGNSSQCVATVTVADTLAPVVSCQAASVVMDPNGWAVVSANALASWTDNCGTGLQAWTSVDSVNVLGDTTIWVYVEDLSGNVDSCAAILTVTDGTAPVAICQDVTVYLDGNGQAGITAADIDGGSTDNGTINALSASQTVFGCDHLGANNVTLTVTDDAGNSASCVAVVTVLDTIAPTVACQAITITLDADGQATITADMLDAGSTDNCGTSALTYTASTTTFTSAGTYTVTLTVTDASGNSSTCTATVQVLPGMTLPVALCQPVTIALDANGQATITASDIDGGSHAEAGIASLIASQTVFGCADLGVQQVTLTVGDILGAIASCVAEVTVIDTLAPILVCQDITIALDANGQATVVAATLAASVIDNCGTGELTYSTDVTTLTSPGEHTVVLTVTDASGNSSTCTATVTVVKTDGPLVIPHGFSPNGDGIADTWVIKGLEKYPNNSVLIFNRWGQEVYEAKHYNNDWTGHAGKQAVFGEELPAAVYFYQLDLGDGEEPRTGYIQLNR